MCSSIVGPLCEYNSIVGLLYVSYDSGWCCWTKCASLFWPKMSDIVLLDEVPR